MFSFFYDTQNFLNICDGLYPICFFVQYKTYILNKSKD